MSAYLIRGPFPGKGGREWCICEVDGKRRKVNYAKFVMLQAGIDVKKYQQVHHIDENKHNNQLSNLENMRGFVHDNKHKRRRRSE
jgi:hypothetical protein